MSSTKGARQQLETLFAKLEADMPRLIEDMNAFYEEFEARSFEIFAVEDSEAVQARLMKMLENAGVS